jgi:hypothetical protein
MPPPVFSDMMRPCTVVLFGTALLACCVTTIRAAVPLRIGLVFDTRHVLPGRVSTASLREAAQIWAPYGVVIGVDAADAAPADAELQVEVDTEREAGDGDNALGELYFTSDGVPGSTVTLYYRPIERLARDASVAGSPARLWPRGLYDQLVSRVIGRTLAHEVGHFVLRTPRHEDRGLMRARQAGPTLVGPGHGAFALTTADQEQLARVLVAEPTSMAAASPGPSRAGAESR